jgi:RimJ/RimL family protein N-acetyltransferase
LIEHREQPKIRLERWSDGDLDLLRRINAPEMTEHLGGPETEEQVVARHKRYVAGIGPSRMFRIVRLPDEAAVGSIGYWERIWRDQSVYETGWSVLPEFQGLGIAATAAAEAMDRARDEQKLRYVHAFPSIHNPASNAVCRKVGFELVAEIDFEYPPGRMMRCNDWRLDLIRL